MKISVRQICFIMLAYTFAGKILTYPAALASEAGRDLLFSAAINFLLCGILIWSVAYMCSRTDKTFFELLYSLFGRAGVIAAGSLFALYFAFCAFYPVLEQERYVHAVFYDTIPSYLTFLPFFAFALYVACKGFTNVGRCADICIPVLAVSVAFIAAMSAGEINAGHFLPVLKTPASGVLSGAYKNFFRFNEPAYMLFFMGRFKYKRGDAAKITLSYAGGAAFTLLTLFAFYGVYSELSPDTQFAIGKISLFFSAINIVGRVDLVVLYALEIVQLFALALNIQLSVYCIKSCVRLDDEGYERSDILPFLSLAVNAALLLGLIFCDSLFTPVSRFYGEWGWIITLIFAAAIPLLTWAAVAADKRRGAHG